MTSRNAGFTLIELMTVVAILAVTLTVGLPGFNEVTQRQTVATTLHQLAGDMAMARSSAVMRRANVVVCPRTADNRCSDAQDWSHGWMVFDDADGDRQPTHEDDILRITDPPAAAVLYLPSSRPALRYQADGRAANTNLTVYVCRDAGYLGKAVVNNLGRVRTERETGPSVACPRA